MNSRISSCFVIISLLAVGSSAAATISFDDTFGPTAVPFPVTMIPLPKFDPALGTLTKVTLTLDADTSGGTIAWDNEAPVSTDIELGIGAEVTAAVSGSPGVVTAVAVPLQTDSMTGVDADNDGAADFIGTDAFAVVGGTGSDSDMDMTTAALDLAFFTAGFLGEMFDVDLSASVETYLSTTGGFGPIDPVPGMTDGMVTVTYEYAGVPEPSAALLACLAVVSGCFRRRRR